MSASSYRVDVASAGLVLACLSGACEPKLVIGKVTIDQESCPLPVGEGGAPGFEDKVIEIGWTTGFENGSCDYDRALGFCYAQTAASYQFVDDPVHGGKSAAAFSVTAQPDLGQSRCFLEGALPRDAVYGAWFYIPALAENTGNWNLMYIQGVVPEQPGLWDVSLGNADDGSLHLYVLSHQGSPLSPNPELPVPIGSWFHVEFRLLRATDATGAVALYQDGVLVQEGTGIVTDAFDFHHWFVGNLASSLMPPDSTVYVDDVTIRAELDPL